MTTLNWVGIVLFLYDARAVTKCVVLERINTAVMKQRDNSPDAVVAVQLPF